MLSPHIVFIVQSNVVSFLLPLHVYASHRIVSNGFMLHGIKLCYTVSHDIITNLILLYYIALYPILWCLIISHGIVTNTLLFGVKSYYILSYQIKSYLILSFHIKVYCIFFFYLTVSNYVAVYRRISYLFLFYHFILRHLKS